jgi:hypothetical protein
MSHHHQSSLDFFSTNREQYINSSPEDQKRIMDSLFKIIKRELIVSGSSPLLNILISVFKLYFEQHYRSKIYEPKYFTYRFSNELKISINYSHKMIIGFFEYFLNRKVSDVFEKSKGDDTLNEFNSILRMIDNEVYKLREKIFSDSELLSSKQYRSEEEFNDLGSHQNNEFSAALIVEAENQSKAIIEKTQFQANSIIEETNKLIALRIEEANKRVIGISHSNISKRYSDDQKNINDGIEQIRLNLLDVNEKMRKLESNFYESSQHKAFTQLIELYNIIADNKDSMTNLYQDRPNSDLSNIIQNLSIYMDMISEYLIDYGVRTLLSESGQKFDSKQHDSNTKKLMFDPRGLVVSESIRCGFSWKNEIIQKEKVILK